MENPYGNLKQGLIRVKAKRDMPVDLARLVQLLEKEVGFEPITEVKLQLAGRLEEQSGKLVFETSGTGQRFVVTGSKAKGLPRRAKDLITATATLKQPKSASHIVIWDWRKGEARD